MTHATVDQWMTSRAELEIRRWLYQIDQWSPQADPAQGLSYTPPFGTLNHDEIDHLLDTEVIGRIGCHADGTTYIVPVTYVYAGGCIYGLTGDGAKLRMLRANPEVCFEVDHIDSLTRWQSVIAWGRFEELHGADAEQALHLLVARVARHIAGVEQPAGAREDDHLLRHADLMDRQAILYRIVLDKRTGRFEDHA